MPAKWVTHYLRFPAREKLALLLLLFTVGLLFLLPVLMPSAATFTTTEELAGTTAAEQQWFGQPKGPEPAEAAGFGQKEAQSYTLFPFDPNTITEADLQKLGLPPKAVSTWINYRNKGGRFKHGQDIARLYSLSPEWKQRLIPYATVATNPGYSKWGHTENKYTPANKYEKKEYAIIDINTATEADWEQLPMIGSYLAMRIVKFRNARKGFSSIEQVSETYGLRPESFEAIRPYLRMTAGLAPAQAYQKNAIVGKPNINTASRDLLLKCPAITEPIAAAIIIQRDKKGHFLKRSDLQSIVFLQPDQIESISTWFGLPNE